MPAYRRRIMSLKTGGGEPRLIKAGCPATQAIYFRQKKSPLRFNNQVVCIKMQSRLSGCMWRTAKIRRGNFQTYRWMADLLQWVPVKTNTQALQIGQNKLCGYSFKNLSGQNCTNLRTQCVFSGLGFFLIEPIHFKVTTIVSSNFMLREIHSLCGLYVPEK